MNYETILVSRNERVGTITLNRPERLNAIARGMRQCVLTEAQARKQGYEVKVGKFPFVALGRAIANLDTDGFAKVVTDAESGQLLGVHIVGNGAGDLISEAAVAIEMGASTADLALTIHPHPTLPEAIMEAAKAAQGEAIHILNR